MLVKWAKEGGEGEIGCNCVEDNVGRVAKGKGREQKKYCPFFGEINNRQGNLSSGEGGRRGLSQSRRVCEQDLI